MSGKIHPKKPVSHAVGPVYTTNDPAKFSNKGKFTGKTMSGKTVVEQATGPVFTVNKAAVPAMSAGQHGSGKSMGQHPDAKFNPMKSSVNLVEQRTASAKSGETTPSYPLKKSYAK